MSLPITYENITLPPSAFTTLNVSDITNNSRYDCICCHHVPGCGSKAPAARRDGFSDGNIRSYIRLQITSAVIENMRKVNSRIRTWKQR